MEENLKHFQFKHPFTCIVAGSTGSGKTVLVRRILTNFKLLFHPLLARLKVLWAHGQAQALHEEGLGADVSVTYHEGLPNEQDVGDSQPNIIVIDDLMSEMGKDKHLLNLFTKFSHHHQISVIFIVQNLFFQAPSMRTISLNAHYFLLLKNPRDKMQVMSLGRQVFPGKTSMFIEAYEDATATAHSYIKVDLTPDTPDKYRLQTRITPQEVEHLKSNFAPIVYMPK